jgi:small-conductance mechanosensitive channel
MNSSLLPVSVLAFVLVSYIALRPFSLRIRRIFDLSCFLGATAILWQHQTSPLPSASATAISPWLHAVAAVWWLLGARVLVALLSFTLNHNQPWREARLFPDLTAASIYAAAVLVVLISVLALPIGGLLATSGVLAIVLGLALQNTLADVFAGISFGIESPFNVGDRISLGEKIEGTVVQMNWRSIRILTDGDDVAIVPNSVVAKSDIVNRSSPTRVRSAAIEVSCPAASNPERVIDTLLNATMLCPTILSAPAAGAVLLSTGSKKARYRVSFSVSDTEHLSSTKDQLLRQARQQLYSSGLYYPRAASRGMPLQAHGEDSAGGALPLLEDITLFDPLNAQQLAQLATHLKPRTLEPREVLFAQGGVDATLFVIVSGIVQVSEETGADEQILGSIGGGDYIGEVSLLTGAPYAATATAKTHCKVYGLDCNVLRPLLAANTDLHAEFDRSARRGLAILNRSVAVRATAGNAGQSLLQRIRALF